MRLAIVFAHVGVNHDSRVVAAELAWLFAGDTVERDHEVGHVTSVAHCAGDALLKYCKIVVVTGGPHGAHAFSRDQGTAHCPTQSVMVVDTVGAGDAFCGAFLAGLMHKAPLEACLKAGCMAGTCAVQHQGAIIPDHAWPELRRNVELLWSDVDECAVKTQEER